jgi:hypothetical protein
MQCRPCLCVGLANLECFTKVMQAGGKFQTGECVMPVLRMGRVRIALSGGPSRKKNCAVYS